MFKIKEFLNSKKTKAFFTTLLVDFVILMVGPEWKEALVIIVSGLGGILITGQAVADAGSKGATSSNAP